MASAESRASQGTNGEFVRGHMRRTYQGPYYPSSSSKSESEVTHHSWKSPNPYLPPDANRRPQMQPNSGHHEDLLHAQLNALELEVLSADFVDQIAGFNGENSGSYVKNDPDPKIQELKCVISNNLPKVPQSKERGEFWYADDYLMDLASFDVACDEPKKVSSNLESNWVGAKKNVPWWRTAYKDELASFVSSKSLDHVENCDLPLPRTESFGMAPSALHGNKIVNSTSDQTADDGIFNLAKCANGSPTSANIDDKQCAPGDLGDLAGGFDKQFRPTSCNDEGSNTTHMDESEIPQRTGVDLSKTELLEALCHSQTRAREAEEAAEQAYNEKEHIIMLFFRQASHLFAYRQWFQILQLENICLQLKNKDHPTCVHFPLFLPLIPRKSGQKRKNRLRKGPKVRKRIHKCAFAFALGFGLAGAGLFLGWSMGWFFPAF